MVLKRVRDRRNDALAGEDWARVEHLLADYYRSEGYTVEHCGTGGRAARFDGGVDLRLRRDGETILVQCKHWNAYQVPHNDVHQLLGIMVNEQATGAIVVTSGEFTRAAIEAATRHGHVQLVDGDDLRRMLGVRFSQSGAGAWARDGQDDGWKKTSGSLGAWAAERLVSAAEDRIRGGGKRRGMSIFAAGAWSGLAAILIKFILAIALLFFMSAALQRAIRNVAPVQPQASMTRATQQSPAASTLVGESPTPAPPTATIHLPTPQEIEEQRRRSAESMEILRASTPELPEDPRRRSVLQ
ncbi:restriction endonuclease [Luteimonas sp. MC1750]|uniref:restriction endonuclease n=1 Tax=Luteimonas sp. MC1750 TaxID=2799326 RepID=UPI0018F0707A|nr:restriction endonuclease [Luteimonas sp. MC1750]MBJ6984341.1 restriction endonuclease [Luteimonas sp. MC1750]QQO05037.1 restriction endonuclease [Luteimonas sp. MC1750]